MARTPNRQNFNHPSLSYEAPSQLRRFRAGLALIVSTLLVAGVWTGLWFAASSYVKAQVVGWSEAQVAAGGPAAYDALELSGFPSRIVLNLANPRYSGPLDGPAGTAQVVAWQGEAMTVSTRPWLPWHLNFDAPGKHQVQWADGQTILAGSVDTLNADVVLGEVWPQALSLNLKGLNLSGDADVVIESLRADLAHDADVQASGDGLTVNLNGTNATLPMHGGWGLGNTLESFDVGLRITGPVMPGVFAQQLTHWRDVGGAVEIERFKLRFGPLGMAAAGTLALDGELQPIGALTAKFEGLFTVLEILRTQGVVRDGDAVLATMALSAFSKRPPGGGPSAINLAVTAQDGQLTLGSVPILKLPTFDWGIAPPAAVAEEAPPVRDYKDVPPIY